MRASPLDWSNQLTSQRPPYQLAPRRGLGSPCAHAALDSVAEDLCELLGPTESFDPLKWPSYEEQLTAARAKSGESEAVVIAEGRVAGRTCTLISFEFNFLGGSMGEAVGSRISAAFAHALKHGHPLVSLISSGGARVQEGMRSLVQMQRITECVARARRAGLVHIAVARHPTTGGVWVSLGAAADVIIGIEHATVAFAGNRVRGGEAAEAAFAAEAKFRDGFIDAVVSEAHAASLLESYVRVLEPNNRAVGVPELPAHPQRGPRHAPASGWQAVLRARSSRRPRALDYLNSYFDERVEISGDRVSGRDEGILCGFGLGGGGTVAYVAQTGTANSAAGFRTATRLLRMANRLGVPVLTLIDTPGAANDETAERAGIGHAIAETFLAMSELTVPARSVVIGEGGSGGALALAQPGELWASPDAYFSVIGPEAAAQIVYRSPDRAPDAADQLGLGPSELLSLGIVNGILGEAPPPSA